LGYLAQDLKGPYSGLAQQLKTAQNPGHAAVLFPNIYERPGTPMIQNRINYAQQAFGSKGGAGVPTVPSQPQSQQNSVAPATLPAITTSSLDKNAFKQANARYIAGSFLQRSAKDNPYGVSGSSPLLAPGLLTAKAPDPANYQKTVTTATAKLQQIAGTPLVNIHQGAKGYVNPIPGAVIGRTDMGVDANLKPGSPILAIGNSRVVGISPDWYKGQPYVQLQLLDGPQKGRTYYVAEQIAPAVKAGQTVRAGQPIGHYASSGTGIEIGWGSPTLGRTEAQATTGYSEGQVTKSGQSFRSFLGGLK
jgi:murein DD-endopeptidase MepM/ murein hydrolase activator NlpD